MFAKPYQQIHAVEAKGRMDDGAIMLDVREPHEWGYRLSRSPGSPRPVEANGALSEWRTSN